MVRPPRSVLPEQGCLRTSWFAEQELFTHTQKEHPVDLGIKEHDPDRVLPQAKRGQVAGAPAGTRLEPP